MAEQALDAVPVVEREKKAGLDSRAFKKRSKVTAGKQGGSC
ncbi:MULTISPECIES: hypothetical protein [unclassified Paracoccus (in: a-proteobacteria)]|jgi:hypothetical protein|nr:MULTISPECIES: hypothetical protein [unclassified Paracoccus (in: a-proteobacteria)]